MSNKSSETAKIETTKIEEENSQNSPNSIKVKTEVETKAEIAAEIRKSKSGNGNQSDKSKNKINQNKFTAKIWQVLNGKIFKILVTGLLSLLFFVFLTMFLLTPSNFQKPLMDHSHFRLQYIFQGQIEDFATPRYQVDYIKDVCSGALTESPIHFHDNKGQIVHLHWQKITGGQVLKFYGLNKIGGIDGIMGWKLDDLAKFKLTQIPIHSQSLPKPKGNDKFWVYTGEKDKFEKRNFEEFVKTDLETFFGQTSIIRQNQEEEEKLKKQSEIFFGIKVQAHSGIDHANETEEQIHLAETQRLENEKKALENRNNNVQNSLKNLSSISNSEQNSQQNLQNISANIFNSNSNSNLNLNPNSQNSSSTNSSFTNSNSQNSIQNNSLPNNSQSNSSQKTETELKKINNLLGNVIIFVQESEPTNDQIKLRFDNLEPLGDSVCGG